MSAIIIVDTSVLLNLVPVPGDDQDRAARRAEFEEYLKQKCQFVLPYAVLIETGRHISKLNDGGQRRQAGKAFATLVSEALAEQNAFVVALPKSSHHVADLVQCFPNKVVRGLSLADLAIILAYENAEKLNPSRRVLIWSQDEHLQGYDRSPTI